MNFAALDKIFISGLQSAIPANSDSCSQWAAEYRFVSPERTARPGKWKNEVVPFLVEIMDAASDPAVRRLVFQKSSQVAGSEFLNNYLGYRIHTDPTMMIYCAENDDKAKAWTYESFDTMVEVTPVLRERVAESKASSGDNNQRRKKFAGGLLSIVYATSAAQLSSRPAEVVAIDEVDACVENSEGSPVVLLEARTKTFNDTKKILLVSSPRDKETSVIEAEYLQSDQRQYYVPCPHCDEFQILKWANVRWDENPAEAFYVCDLSGCLIEHDEKTGMLAKGQWRAAQPFRGTAGFKINEMYSPFTNWGTMASAFVKAKKFRSELKTFVNTSLGETWEESGEEIEFADLTFLREDYAAPVPRGVLVLTAGVDIQDDRIEIETVGWGRDFENWSIDYKVIEGSPGLFEVWDDLSDYLLQEFDGEDGKKYKISAAAIDTGGHHTDKTYTFVKANKGRRWFAVKGANVYGQPIVSKPKLIEKNGQKIRLFHVGTDTAKDEIFSYLRVSRAGEEASGDGSVPGFCHFPADYEESYFKQLCAEKKITKYTMGVARQVYVKVSANARNEALDCRVYATAARAILNPNFEKLAQHRFRNETKRVIRETISRKITEIAEKTGEEIPDSLKEELENLDDKPKRRRIIVKNSPFSGRKKRNFAAD